MMRIRDKKRGARPFTLVEILIVIALITMMAGVLALNIRQAVDEQRFISDAQRVVDRLRLAQNLMLIYGLDVLVFVKENQDKVTLWMEFDSPRKLTWLEALKKPVSMNFIQHIHLMSGEGEREGGTLALQFLSKGSVMTKGNLRLSRGDRQRVICLNGTPQPIKVKAEPEEYLVCPAQDAHLRDLALLTRREIEEP